MSRDHGLTWSAPTTFVDPGASTAADRSAVLDGGAFFDAGMSTWHLLAQCVGAEGTGWALCHYTRRAISPLGPFAPDPSNPVVKGGTHWSRLFSERNSACPPGMVDEGTPDIVSKRDGCFLVTLHGFDPATYQGYRNVADTADFRRWRLTGGGLSRGRMRRLDRARGKVDRPLLKLVGS